MMGMQVHIQAFLSAYLRIARTGLLGLLDHLLQVKFIDSFHVKLLCHGYLVGFLSFVAIPFDLLCDQPICGSIVIVVKPEEEVPYLSDNSLALFNLLFIDFPYYSTLTVLPLYQSTALYHVQPQTTWLRHGERSTCLEVFQQ